MTPEVFCTAYLLALYALPVVLLFAVMAALAQLLEKVFPDD